MLTRSGIRCSFDLALNRNTLHERVTEFASFDHVFFVDNKLSAAGIQLVLQLDAKCSNHRHAVPKPEPPPACPFQSEAASCPLVQFHKRDANARPERRKGRAR